MNRLEQRTRLKNYATILFKRTVGLEATEKVTPLNGLAQFTTPSVHSEISNNNLPLSNKLTLNLHNKRIEDSIVSDVMNYAILLQVATNESIWLAIAGKFAGNAFVHASPDVLNLAKKGYDLGKNLVKQIYPKTLSKAPTKNTTP